MQSRLTKRSSLGLLTLAAAGLFVCSAPLANTQSDQMLDKLMQVKMAADANKAALATYTWQQQQTVSIKGDVKSTTMYQIRIGPDGTQQKTDLSAPPPPPSGGRLRQHIVAKKTEEYKDYAQQMVTTAKQYAPPTGALLDQAYKAGNIAFVPAPGTVSLVIKNYIKPGDSMTIVFDTQQKAILSLKIASYMADPSDPFTVTVTYAKLPQGSNQISQIQVYGQSKQLGITLQNSNFQKIM
jgi:hypothetical protein